MMSDKRKYKSLREFLSYLKGDLSGWERNDLEREMEADPFAREAMEGFEGFAPEDIESDMMSLESRMKRRISRRRRITFYSAAAAIASILIVSTFFVKLHDFNAEEASEKLSERAIQKTEPAIAPQSGIPDRGEEEEVEVLVEEGVEEGVEDIAPAKKAPATGKKKSEGKQDISEAPEKEIISDKEKEFAVITVIEAEAKSVEKIRISEPSAISGKKSSAEPFSVEEMAESVNDLRYIKGVVISSEDSMPIPGASVMIKGTTLGAVTDIDGNFKINSAGDSSPTLVASYVGMESKEIDIQDKNNITVSMSPDVATLDEVVVTGYGLSGAESAEAGSVRKVGIAEKEAAQTYIAPEPVGGQKLFKNYIEENIRYPEGYDTVSRVVVVLRFTLKTDGIISDIEVLRTGGPSFSEEARRLLLEGPDWNPAERDGVKIEEQVKLRIVFER